MGVLSTGQKKLLGEFLTNFALALFAGAIISPVYTKTLSIKDVLPETIIGVITSVILIFTAFSAVKDIES